jgi:O-antigen/teichoic acid export membrane protein
MPKPRVLEQQPLKYRILQAGLWTGMLNGLARAAALVRNVLLARLLSPHDFGLFGIALAVLSVVERFSSTGLQTALLQRHSAVDEYLDTAWTTHVLRGGLLCTALILTAEWIAVLLGEPRAAPLIALVGVAVLLRGLENPAMLLYRRELLARYAFMHRAGPLLVELAVAVALAVVLRSAWALGIGLVSGKLAQLIMSYTLHSYRPRVRLHWHQIRELSLYGRWVFFDNLLFLLAFRIDKLIVGKAFGAAALGAYMLAYSVSEVVTTEITRFSQEIAFPAYARMQHDIARIRHAFTLALEIIASIAFPLAAVLGFMSDALTHVLFGSRWMQAAMLLPALAVASGIRAITASGTVALAALGHPSLVFRLNLVAVVTTYLVLIPAVGMGSLAGVAWAAAFGAVASLVPFGQYLRQTTGITVGIVARHLMPGAVLVAIVSITTAALDTLLPRYTLAGMLGVLCIELVVYATGATGLWVVARRGPISALMLLRTTSAATLA